MINNKLKYIESNRIEYLETGPKVSELFTIYYSSTWGCYHCPVFKNTDIVKFIDILKSIVLNYDKF